MTLNPFQDGAAPRAPAFNAGVNAHGGEAVVSGCAPSAGAGTWEIDVASGTVFVAGTGAVSVSADTVSVTAPGSDADMDAGEARVDLVTVNTSGSVVVTEGTAASTPNSPDIPADEVLIAWAYIRESDSSLAGSDINDRRVLLGDVSALFEDGGSFEIDAAELAGGDGSADEYLTTDGAAAAWTALSDDFATETGSFAIGNEASTSTVSLSNDYQLLTGWASATNGDADGNEASAGIQAVDTVNDEITIAFINSDASPSSETVYWGVFGLLA